MKIIAQNKKAYHEYFIEERYECGIALSGCEVKSLREGAVNLKDSFAMITKNMEIMLLNMHISPYKHGSYYNPEPTRERRLLLHKNEICRLFAKVSQKGYTLVPVSLYFKDALVKVELALCKGKELHDKRTAIAEKQTKRDAERAMKEYAKYK